MVLGKSTFILFFYKHNLLQAPSGCKIKKKKLIEVQRNNENELDWIGFKVIVYSVK